MKKIFIFESLFIFLFSLSCTTQAAPAPFNEYYYNPENKECTNLWRGDENGGPDIPRGFYFSGYDDVNCIQFDLKRYQECKSLGGRYLSDPNKGLFFYNCSLDVDSEAVKNEAKAEVRIDNIKKEVSIYQSSIEKLKKIFFSILDLFL